MCFLCHWGFDFCDQAYNAHIADITHHAHQTHHCDHNYKNLTINLQFGSSRKSRGLKTRGATLPLHIWTSSHSRCYSHSEHSETFQIQVCGAFRFCFQQCRLLFSIASYSANQRLQRRSKPSFQGLLMRGWLYSWIIKAPKPFN